MSKASKNNLLISGDYPLIASPTLAKAYGVAAATFLQKLHYCLQSNEVKIHQNKKYWFHSYEQWVDTLGLYSVSTIKRVVSKLKHAGILITHKLAKNKWVQTNFYTIDYKKLKQLMTVKNGPENQPVEPTPIPTVTVTSLVNSVQAVQPSMPSNSIQQILQPVNVESTPSHTSLKVAKESHPHPNLVIPENKAIQGLSQPLYPIAPDEVLKNMSMDYRYFYQALRQQKVDIHYDDQRIQQLLKYQKFIIRHIVYIKQSFWGQERYQWHTFEQLQMERYLRKK
ncbi:MAG: hypothetical protein LKF82_05355 [Acinetobacter populi]|jgi:DNA polymerase III gamma/tau subunit|uniref:hypothetical protein n=1 Tax=Acinetobacter populi TaxID=1582270 RepID=UPI0023553F11|nr:hypothetical protein [Acinetobacter populi]MCH4247251.1 hypothetical protein [Acinetobacter populi]